MMAAKEKAKQKAVHSAKGRKAALRASKKKAIQRAKPAPRGRKTNRHIAKARQLSASALKARRETFEAAVPKLEEDIGAGRRQELPQKKFELPESVAEKSIGKKKSIPHALTAVLGATALTAVIGSVLLALFGLDMILAMGLTLPLFVGFSILFYNYFEGTRGQ